MDVQVGGAVRRVRLVGLERIERPVRPGAPRNTGVGAQVVPPPKALIRQLSWRCAPWSCSALVSPIVSRCPAPTRITGASLNTRLTKHSREVCTS